MITVALLATATATAAAGVTGNVGAAKLADIDLQGSTGSNATIDVANHLMQPLLVSDDALEMSAAKAARIARSKFGGKVLSVSQAGTGDDVHYNVRLLKAGNVRVVRIPLD